MLEIKFIRENPVLVEADLRKRNDLEKLPWIKDLLVKDEKYRLLLQETESLRKKRNDLTKEIEVLLKQKKDAKKLIQEAKELPSRIKYLEESQNVLREQINFYLMRIPNILHESVPIGKDDSENVVVKTHGKPVKSDFNLLHHGELAERLGGADFKKAVQVSGSGFYYLKGDIALLDLALQRFGIDLLLKKGFTFIEPPFLLRKKAYEGVTDLNYFKEVLYKIEGEELFLIATSEHPLVSLYSNDILSEEVLPIKLTGLSPCFRKEIGKHSIDERGLFRVHQFNKVEQVILCHPNDSWRLHEELLKNSEELLQKLEIPYRVVNVCTGDIGSIAAKKYDIEGFSPREEKFIELMSCSNCTSYQAVRSNIKFRKKNGEKEFVHTLNNTMIATSRVLRIILETFQQKDGSVKIPKALHPYMNGLKELTVKK